MGRLTLTLSLLARFLWLVLFILFLFSLYIEPTVSSLIWLGLLTLIGLVSFYRKMITQPVKIWVDWVSSLSLECVSLAATLLFYVLGFFDFDQKRKKTSASTPILLVHGYLHNRSAWLYLKYRLTSKGIGPIFTLNLGSPFLSIEDYAKKVDSKAQEIEKLTGRKDLVLIGHSMGGLVSAYYATHLAAIGTVTDVITLGTPAQGTKISVLGVGASAREMEYQSPFVRSLNAAVNHCVGIRFLSIGSLTDLIIIPHSSAHFTSHKVRKMTIADQGHLHFLYSDVIADNIMTYLHWQRVMSVGSVAQSPRHISDY